MRTEVRWPEDRDGFLSPGASHFHCQRIGEASLGAEGSIPLFSRLRGVGALSMESGAQGVPTAPWYHGGDGDGRTNQTRALVLTQLSCPRAGNRLTTKRGKRRGRKQIRWGGGQRGQGHTFKKHFLSPCCGQALTNPGGGVISQATSLQAQGLRLRAEQPLA